MSLIGPSASLRLFTMVTLATTVIFTFGLRDLHFTERNYYTVLANKLERLFEGRIKCEVVPPSKYCDDRNELLSPKTGDIEKAEKKNGGQLVKKDTKKTEKDSKLDNLNSR